MAEEVSRSASGGPALATDMATTQPREVNNRKTGKQVQFDIDDGAGRSSIKHQTTQGIQGGDPQSKQMPGDREVSANGDGIENQSQDADQTGEPPLRRSGRIKGKAAQDGKPLKRKTNDAEDDPAQDHPKKPKKGGKAPAPKAEVDIIKGSANTRGGRIKNTISAGAQGQRAEDISVQNPVSVFDLVQPYLQFQRGLVGPNRSTTAVKAETAAAEAMLVRLAGALKEQQRGGSAEDGPKPAQAAVPSSAHRHGKGSAESHTSHEQTQEEQGTAPKRDDNQVRAETERKKTVEEDLQAKTDSEKVMEEYP